MLRRGRYYDNLHALQPDHIEGQIFYNPPGSYMCSHYNVGANVNVVDMYGSASNNHPSGSFLITEDDPLFEKFRAFITLSSTLLSGYDYYELDITVREYRELYETWRAEEEELASYIKE